MASRQRMVLFILVNLKFHVYSQGKSGCWFKGAGAIRLGIEVVWVGLPDDEGLADIEVGGDDPWGLIAAILP